MPMAWRGVIKFLSQIIVFFNLITPTLSSSYTVKLRWEIVSVSRLHMSKAGYNFISQKI